MAKRPTPFRPFNEAIGRRQFLRGVSLGTAAVLLGGCGSSSDEYVFTNNAPNQGNSPEAQAVQGTVNLAELGGGPLVVSTAQQANSGVGTDGRFTTQVAGLSPQITFALVAPSASSLGQNSSSDLSLQQIRGLAVYLPNTPLVVDATSTALALVYLSFGVLTPDFEQAKTRLTAVKQFASFASLVELLRGALPQGGLTAALEAPQMQSLRDQIVDELIASESPRARKLTADEHIAQGGVSIERELEGVEPGFERYTFENYGYRFVTVAREELDASGQQTTVPVLATLPDAARFPLTEYVGNQAVMGGANGLSWGTAFTFQVGDPGGGTEDFIPHPNTRKVRYWIRGIGGGGASNVPQSVRQLNFGNSEFVNTSFFYFVLPLIDALSGGLAGLALYRYLRGADSEVTPQIIELSKLLGTFAVDAGTQTQYGSLVSKMSGTPIPTDQAGIKSFFSILIDLTVAFGAFALDKGRPVIASTIAAAAARVAASGGVAGVAATTAAPAIISALGFIAGTLTVATTGVAVYNIGKAAQDLIRLPFLTPIELAVGSELELLGTSQEIQVLDLNGDGAMAYNKNGKLYLREASGTEVELLDAPGDAKINREGDIFYQLADRQGPARLRDATSGFNSILQVPLSSQSEYPIELIGLTPRREFTNERFGPLPMAVAIDQDNQADIYTTTTAGILFTNLQEGTSSSSVRIVGMGRNRVVGNAGLAPNENPGDNRNGATSSRSAHYDIDARQWSSVIHHPGDLPAGFGVIDINNNDDVLTTETFSQTNDDDKPSPMTWSVWIIESGQRDLYSTTRQSKVSGPSRTSTVATTIDYVDAPGIPTYHTVTSLNDDGDVVGTYTPTGGRGEYPALWRSGQAPVDLLTLFPPAAQKTGRWVPKRIRGRRVLLERTIEDRTEFYLFTLAGR